MASALTRDQIIGLALRKAGNTTLTDDAIEWLGNFLDRMTQEYKWEFLEKTSPEAALAAGTTSVALPADFADVWDEYGLQVYDGAGVAHHLDFIIADEYNLIPERTALGEPQMAIADLNAMVWFPYPVPEFARTYTLHYKLKSARPSTDVVVWFPNDSILVQAVFVEALSHEDDDRYPTEYARLWDEKQGMIAKYRSSFNRSNLKKSSQRLNPSKFKGIVSWR